MKVLVSHPLQQHSYKLASAVKKIDKLDKYLTTVYYDKNKWNYKLISKIISKENVSRMKSRNDIYLTNKTEVIDENKGLIFLFLTKIIKNKRIVNLIAQYLSFNFSRKVVKYCRKNEIDIIISFDNYSSKIFKDLKDDKIIKILDMSSIPIKNILKNYNEYLNSEEITSEEEKSAVNLIKSYTKKMIQNSEVEIKHADYFIVASNYTKNELLKKDIKKSKIFVIPYGVKIEEYKPTLEFNKINKEEISILFVGRMNVAKGFYKVLDVAKNIKNKQIIFYFVGDKKELCIQENLPDNIKIIGSVPKKKIKYFYEKADILILPTLFDGFGLSVIEAMASGCAIITTNNCGASDIVRQENAGIILDKISYKEIELTIHKLINDKKLLNVCKENSMHAAYKYTWDEYNNKIATMLDIIEDRVNE